MSASKLTQPLEHSYWLKRVTSGRVRFLRPRTCRKSGMWRLKKKKGNSMLVIMCCLTRRRCTRAQLFYSVRREAFWRSYNWVTKSWRWLSRRRICKCRKWLTVNRKQRIERRGPIAKDVILDVEAFKPTLAKSLLDEITLGKNNDSKLFLPDWPLRVPISVASNHNCSPSTNQGFSLYWKCASVFGKRQLRRRLHWQRAASLDQTVDKQARSHLWYIWQYHRIQWY